MNNGHLPAGRAVQGGAAGPGMVDMTGERHGSGPGGGSGRNGEGGGGRGGGRGRGRHYGPHYQPHFNHNHNHNGHHNQQYGQYTHNNQGNQYSQYNQHQQVYPGYVNPYGGHPYQYAQIQPPYAPNGGMPGTFMPYQQPYGRPAAGMAVPYAPMMAPGAIPQMTQPVSMHPQAHPSLTMQPQHPQHSALLQQPPMSPPYARTAQQAPLVVSTPNSHQVSAPPPPIHGIPPPPQQQSPIASLPYQSPQLPAAMGLPPAPHGVPLPLRPEVVHSLPQGPVTFPSSNQPLNLVQPTPLLPSHAVTQQPADSSVPDESPSDILPDSEATSISEAATAATSVANVPEKQPTEPLSSPEPSLSGLKTSSDSAVSLLPPLQRGSTLLFGDISTKAAGDRPNLSQLPWLSQPGDLFPLRGTKSRRRRRRMGDTENVELPQNPAEAAAALAAAATLTPPETPKAATDSIATAETPSTQGQPPGSATSTSHTTPSSVAVAATGPTPTKSSAATSKTAIPALPIMPALPVRGASGKPTSAEPPAEQAEGNDATKDGTTVEADASKDSVKLTEAAAPAPLRPVLWSGLFGKSAAAAASGAAGQNGTAAINGHETNGANGLGAFPKANANSLAEAISAYRVGSSDKVAFIEPRGLINTGNMCYMNSVLQALTFCIPFYDFLDQVGKKAAFSFKSETPMIDAMIMFLREFKVIDRADPIDLQRRLKSDDLERYGEAFIPEFVYEAIKQLSRFSSMRRGHQQDAEEFLGFLLECLNEECAKVIQEASVASNPSSTPNSTTQVTPAASVASEVPDPSGGGWLEVGPRQRAAVTRSSGHASVSPVNSIFGGQLRSELRVPGLKDSVTMEPYQSLQLHIDSPEVRNIVDALRGLTKPEILQGNFNSPHGKNVNATKQVFIENVPPMLILHLKRFQFDSQGGTVKIWKKVGYPLELEVPREVFSRRMRNNFLSEALPKYRLNAVIYHHGKQASGGHYTVDVLREDGREWIRLDDTVIRRIRSEDVAEGGAEESGSGKADNISGVSGREVAAAAASAVGSANRFAAMGDDDAGGSDSEWRQVSAPVNGGNKKWSAVANGSAPATPTTKAKQVRESVKDNKVAYLLFYQRVN